MKLLTIMLTFVNQSVQPVAHVWPKPLVFASVAFWANHCSKAEVDVRVPFSSATDACELASEPTFKLLEHFYSSF